MTSSGPVPAFSRRSRVARRVSSVPWRSSDRKTWRQHMNRKFARRGIAVAVTLALVGIYAIIPTAPSGANHATSVSGVFESNDGNLAVDHTGQTPAAIDWNSFTNAATATAWNFEQFGDQTG